jgi:tryptophan-rich sensory protein
MKNKPWKNYVFWIALTVAVGFVSGLLTRQGTELYKNTITKPPLSPPAIVFPIVWTILYALMGYCAARVSLTPPSKDRRSAIYLYIAQLAFNFFWSIIFFNFQAFLFAFIWLVALWILIFFTIRFFRKVDTLAGNLMIPYLVWVTFAGYLNLGVWLLNR